MLNVFLKKVFGSRNERTLRRMQKTVAQINGLEPSMQALSDSELHAKTAFFKQQIQQLGHDVLDRLLPEAFAVVREASVRALGMRHFDAQLIGGMVLHEGNIAEMRTGEGKTLVATLPAYLNALTGDGVHIVTVNDYLAKRDSSWMKPVFNFLGLEVGVIYPDMMPEEKKQAYGADIVYGTNNEFGFDYLRDNMTFSAQERVQGSLHFAIVDEVDSILIDEARTPLIISGAAEDSSELYRKINKLIPKLNIQTDEEKGAGDYTIDEKQKQAHLTESGHQNVESLLLEANLIEPGQSLYHANNIMLMHHINAALKAHALFHRDVDYIVQNDQVVIVDEHTGRTMPGRRWSEGLHQAVEAKENVAIQHENQTLASVTFQNYFRLYDKLSGMTGTADTEAFEFQHIYNLEVVVIPTNKPMQRKDEADLVYMGQEDKYQAIIEDIKDCVARNQPVLVGTASIESSELLSSLLKKAKIKHQVLNAKFHEKEAEIIAEAGRPGVVTIATNMAGRGTDIVLGGNLSAELAAQQDSSSEDEIKKIKEAWKVRHQTVIEAGGLRIIGSERHESRRIDNQLRGRAGRQGDPGSSRFYLSLDDNLLRIFASPRVVEMMRRLGMKPGEPIEHKLVTRAIENAQRKLEGYHFDVRKQLLSYDDVANQQRKIIYTQRAEIMAMEDPKDAVANMREFVIDTLVERYLPEQSLEEEWDVSSLTKLLVEEFNVPVSIQSWIDEDHLLTPADICKKLKAICDERYQEKETMIGREAFAQFEKSIILQTIDNHWREHLAAMDYLRQGIHLRGYAQKDPKQEYKREAYDLFSELLHNVKYEIVRLLLAVEIQSEADVAAVEDQRRQDASHVMQFLHPEDEADTESESNNNVVHAPFRRTSKKVGRNDPCPCGSGKKYKICHGKLQ